MIGRLRRSRLLAPVLFGSLLTGGCQLFGPDAPPKTQTGLNDNKTTKTDAPSLLTGSGDRKNEAGPDQPVATAFRNRPESESRDAAAVTLDPRTKEAPNVSYIPPTAPTPGASGPAGLTIRPNANQQTAGDAAPGRILSPPPGESLLKREDEMTMKSSVGDANLKLLQTQIQQNQQRLEQRDKAVRQSEAEVQAAAEALRTTRAKVESSQKELDDVKTQLRNRDKEDIAILTPLVEALERRLKEEAPPENRDGSERPSDR